MWGNDGEHECVCVGRNRKKKSKIQSQGDKFCRTAVDIIAKQPGKKYHLLHCQGQMMRHQMTKDQVDKPSGSVWPDHGWGGSGWCQSCIPAGRGAAVLWVEQMETKPTKRERVKYPNRQLAISYHSWCDNGKKPVRPGPSLTARWGRCNAKCSAGINSRGVNISAPGDATTGIPICRWADRDTLWSGRNTQT